MEYFHIKESLYLYFLYLNTKKPHSDFPIVSTTVFPGVKPLKYEGGEPSVTEEGPSFFLTL